MDEGIKFRVWNEIGDFFGEYDDRSEAADLVEELRSSCQCGTTGTPECGVMQDHGYFYDVIEAGFIVRSFM